LNDRDLRQEIVRTCRRMSTSGLVAGTEGNVSARTPGGDVLVTPSGLDYSVMAPEDVVLVTLDGEPLEAVFGPSVETSMHAGIYRSRSEARAVVHTHARFSTTLACLDWEIPPVHYMLAVLSDEGRVPVARYATYGTDDLAENAVRALGSAHRACLLRNHGTIVVGSTVDEALSRTELLEQMAELYYRTRVAGEPVILTTEEMDDVSAKIHDYGQSKSSRAREGRL